MSTRDNISYYPLKPRNLETYIFIKIILSNNSTIANSSIKVHLHYNNHPRGWNFL